jgi:multiple sugar transport system permease protein
VPASRSFNAYAFLAFPLTILFVFTLVPTVMGLGLSLFQWDGGTARFVGLANFRNLLADEKFPPALRNTLVFVLATVPITTVAAFLLAVLVQAKWFVGKTAIRTLFFMPTVVSIVAIGFVWRWLLDADAGPVTALARSLGWADPPNWLQDGSWPMVAIIAVSIWRGVGFCLVLYLAALGQISESLYEAAEIDGASRGGILRHITWPQVAPMTIFLLVTGVIGALQVFDIVYVMTGQSGQTGETNATNVLNLYLYRQFTYGQYGYAAAIAVVIFALTLTATLVQMRLLRSKESPA